MGRLQRRRRRMFSRSSSLVPRGKTLGIILGDVKDLAASKLRLLSHVKYIKFIGSNGDVSKRERERARDTY